MKKKYNLIINIAGDWYGNYHRRDLIIALSENRLIERVFVIGIPADLFHSPIKKFYRFKHAIKSIFKSDKYNKKIWIYTPLIFIHYLVGVRLPIARKLNKIMFYKSLNKLIKREKIQTNILYSVFRPELLDFIDISGNLKVVYDCYDEYMLNSDDEKKKYLDIIEPELFKRSDYVFTTSSKLKSKALLYNNNSYLIPNAANVKLFQKAYIENLKIPKDLKNIKPPIIGYIGVFRNWIDYELLNFLFDKNPDKSFVFVGNWLKHANYIVNKFSILPNVFFLGRKDMEQIPTYLKYFDIAMIPNKINKFNQNVLPLKLFEYLAAGKKIISTNTSNDLHNYYSDYIEIANDYEDFDEKIKFLLNDKSFDPQKVFEFGLKQSWDSRVNEMLNVINSR